MASKSEFSVSKVRNAPLRGKERAYHCSEGAGAMAEEEREERRREKRRLAMERRQMLKGRPELTGIDAA